jgi:hypothetical protein
MKSDFRSELKPLPANATAYVHNVSIICDWNFTRKICRSSITWAGAAAGPMAYRACLEPLKVLVSTR